MKLIIYGTEQKPGEDAKKKVDSSLCHEECVSSCTGTEPSDCDECKHNFYVDDTGKKVNKFLAIDRTIERCDMDVD